MHAQNNNGNGNGNSNGNANKVKVKQDKNATPNKQKKQKPNKAKAKDRSDDVYEVDDDRYDADDDGYGKKNKVKSNNGKGNAYGQHKYGLEGREFGQERARRARLQNQQRRDRLQQTVILTRDRIPTLRERIENAKILLEKQRPTISVSLFDERQQKITLAEQKLTTLEKMLVIAQTLAN